MTDEPMTLFEVRPYESARGIAARDIMGRKTQTTIDATCPFCRASVTLYVWSLCGGGKRCRCGAKFHSGGTAERLRPGAMISETPDSSARRREWEVIAPGGHRFTDGLHILTVQGSRGDAELRARGAEIVPCPTDCVCRRDGEDGREGGEGVRRDDGAHLPRVLGPRRRGRRARDVQAQAPDGGGRRAPKSPTAGARSPRGWRSAWRG